MLPAVMAVLSQGVSHVNDGDMLRITEEKIDSYNLDLIGRKRIWMLQQFTELESIRRS